MKGAKAPSGSPSRSPGAKLRIPSLPLEWMDASVWRLPSGKALAEFALQAGFLAPLLLKTEKLPPPGRTGRTSKAEGVRAEECR